MAGNSGGKNPAVTKRGRFNANPTPCGHAGCIISQRAKRDKDAYRDSPNKSILYISQARGMFHVAECG